MSYHLIPCYYVFIVSFQPYTSIICKHLHVSLPDPCCYLKSLVSQTLLFSSPRVETLETVASWYSPSGPANLLLISRMMNVLSHHCDRTLHRSSVRRKGWGVSLPGPLWWGRRGQVTRVSLAVATLHHSQEAERRVLFIQLRSPADRLVPPWLSISGNTPQTPPKCLLVFLSPANSEMLAPTIGVC